MAAMRRAQLIRGLGSAVPDKRSHADPATVRVVEYALAGSAAVYRLITTISDPAQAPAADLAALYAQRWGLEAHTGDGGVRGQGSRGRMRQVRHGVVRLALVGIG
jgi:hypothetical protein